MAPTRSSLKALMRMLGILGHEAAEPPYSPQLSIETFACAAVGEHCRGGVVVCAIMPSEGMTVPRILQRRVRFAGKQCLDLSSRCLKD